MVLSFVMAELSKKKALSDVRVMLDTSVLLAYVNERDTHHLSVASALGAIKPYVPSILIPSVVLMEVMGKLIKRNKCTSASAEKLLKKALREFDARHEIAELNRDYILDRYKEYAKGNLHTLSGVDFYIAVEAISADAILLTCDVEMHGKTRSRHAKTFLLAAGKSELARLVKHLDKATE